MNNKLITAAATLLESNNPQSYDNLNDIIGKLDNIQKLFRPEGILLKTVNRDLEEDYSPQFKKIETMFDSITSAVEDLAIEYSRLENPQ